MKNIYKQWLREDIITRKQYAFLEAIRTNQLVSLYYELRVILYLGITLFTSGLGYFAYQNIGELGHIIAIVLIGILILICFYFIQKWAKPYSNKLVDTNHNYFDYILILVSLLIITLFTYIQVYFNLVEVLIHSSAYISSLLLFFMAYRYDNRALLSMGISALAAAVGISVTPINWAKGEWFLSTNLYVISLFFGFSLYAIGHLSYLKEIKRHFKFTYQHFGLLLYYVGLLAAIFDTNHSLIIAFLLLLSGILLSFYTWKNKEFLFFLYSNLAVYISFTYLLILLLDSFGNAYELLFYYFPFSCIGYILFLIKHKPHFAHD